jgi:hypothetical protein
MLARLDNPEVLGTGLRRKPVIFSDMFAYKRKTLLMERPSIVLWCATATVAEAVTPRLDNVHQTVY